MKRTELAFASIDHRQLGVMRIGILGTWAVMILCDPLHELARLPMESFHPYGVMCFVPPGLVEILHTSHGLSALKWGLFVAICAGLVGLGNRPIILGALSLLLTFWQGYVRGFGGHVYHQEICLLWATYALAVTPCYSAFSVRGSDDGRFVFTEGLVWSAFALLMTFSYAFTGAARIGASGLEMYVDNQSLTSFVLHNSMRFGYWPSIDGSWLFDHRSLALLLNFSFLPATLFEIASPFAVFSRRVRVAWAVLAILFHLAIAATMQIFFVQNIILLLFFIDPLLDGMGPAQRPVASR